MNIKNNNTRNDSQQYEAAHFPSMLMFGLSLAKIVTITVGGGYAIAPVMSAHFSRKGWINEADFYEIIARAQTLPGPIAFNAAVLSGIRLFGLKGILPAILGTITIPFIVIAALGSLLVHSKIQFIQDFLTGAKFATPGVVLAFLIKNSVMRKWNITRIISVIAASALFILFPIYAIPILVVCIVLFFFLEKHRAVQKKETSMRQ